MTSTRRPADLTAILAEEDYVRGLARALLFDEHDVDDVVQQTWIVALAGRPAATARPAVRAWLATVVRRTVARSRRASARRERRERVAAIAEASDADVGDWLAREQVRRIVVAELEQLDEPYRSAVALRYLDGFEPAEIARRAGVPASTVRARVRRGLERLREALDRRHAGDRRAWCLALVPLAVPPATAPAVGVGVIGKFVALLCIVCGLAFMLVHERFVVGRPTAERAVVVVESDGVVAVPAASDGARPAAGDARRPAASHGAGPLRIVTLRGRCVDEAGLPLADVTVTPQASVRNPDDAERWKLVHGAEPTPIEPDPQVTGADGRFTWRLGLPESFELELRITADGRVPLRVRRPGVDAAELDVGDITLRRGVAIGGAVVDRHGAPLSGVRVMAMLVGGEPPTAVAGLGHDDLALATTGRDGGFAFDAAILPGEWSIGLGGMKRVEPAGTVDVRFGMPGLRIVAAPREPRRVAAAIRGTLRGRVFGASGAPLIGAKIHAAGIHAADRSLVATTDSAGRFACEVDAAQVDSLTVRASGHAPWRSTGPVPVDAGELRVTLASGPELTLRVRADDAPVERFAVRVHAASHGAGLSSLAHTGDHPDGILALPPLEPGRYLVSVEAATPDRIQAAPIEVELEASQTVDVALVRRGAREVHVVDARDRTPVAGVQVRLGRMPDGGPIAVGATLRGPGDAWYAAGTDGVAFDVGVTDDRGRVTLRGPEGVDLRLSLPGPGHVPHCSEPGRVDADGPWQVAVSPGGTLRGDIGPADVVAALRARSDAPLRVELFGLEPWVNLRIPAPSARASGAGILDVDGRFELRGVPPGRWRVRLCWREPGPGGPQDGGRVAVFEVAIRDGVEQRVSMDLAHWRRVDVPVTVRIDDSPAQGTGLKVIGQRFERGWNGGEELATAVLDAEGGATLSLCAGTWVFLVGLRCGESRVDIAAHVLRVDPPLDPTRDPRAAFSPSRIELDLRCAQHTFAFTDAEGVPVAGLPVWVRAETTLDPSTSLARHVPGFVLVGTTDAAGRITVDRPAGEVSLRVPRAAFVDDSAWWAWRSAHPGRDSERWIAAGRAAIAPGAPPTVLALPPLWRSPPE